MVMHIDLTLKNITKISLLWISLNSNSKWEFKIFFDCRGISKICSLMESFYGDSSTAYVFTSDHGMSNKGSHGDGEKDNTETPIVTWGAGMKSPGKIRNKENSESPKEWALDHLPRFDVRQADVAPLMVRKKNFLSNQ
jgi:hypothetical protein